MKKRFRAIVFILVCCFFGGFFFHSTVEARTTAEQKKEYVAALSRLMKDGVGKKNMDINLLQELVN